MSESRPQVRGSDAEAAVVDAFGLERESTSWYDAINPRTGTKYEAKSGREKVRIWEDQHRSLVASDRAGTAWYAFVYVDAAGRVQEIQRRRPSTVTQLVEDAGGWVKSGHARTSDREKKLSIETVIL